MSDIRDGSGLFSMRGMFQREHQRIAEELEAERQRLEARERARIEHQREAWELAEQLRRDEQDRLRRAAQQRRDDQARIATIRECEIERMRLEADARAELEVAARKHEHDLKLEAIREQGRRRRAEQLALVVGALLIASIAAGLAFYFVKLRPEAERMHAVYEQLVQAERSRAEQTQLMLERSEKRRRDLARQLERAERERDKSVPSNLQR
jgi:hypothetical protein